MGNRTIILALVVLALCDLDNVWTANKHTDQIATQANEIRAMTSHIQEMERQLKESYHQLEEQLEEQQEMIWDLRDAYKLLSRETDPTVAEPALEYEPEDEDTVPGVY